MIGKLLHLYVHQPVRTNSSPPISSILFRLLPKLKVNNSFNYVHRIWSICYRKDSSVLKSWFKWLILYDSYIWLMILVSIQYYICRILLTGCHMTGGQPHRQPQFDKFVMIFVTEKGVKTFRGNHNQSAASYSLKDDSSTIDKASGCMIRNSPCILLGKDYT